MSKQQRPSKSANGKKAAAAPAVSTPERVAVRPLQTPAPPPLPVPQPPIRRSTYIEAVAVYERGLEALRRHDYLNAGELFESVLRQYPEEKELHERVRLYLNICRRQASQQEPAPQTIESGCSRRPLQSTAALRRGSLPAAPGAR